MNIRILRVALVAAFLTLTSALHAQVPQLINYQGRVAVGTTNFNSPPNGLFKFALVQGAGPTLLWKNDGSAGNTEPATAVSLTVTKGLYSVLLGDTTLAGMAEIPNSVFANSDVRLRVWFNDGTNGSQLLTPDQRIAAVGYAMVASTLQPGATITTSTATPAVTVANSTDNPAALSPSAPYHTWWVGQNKPPDNATGYLDHFYIYDQQANATRLRIDTAGAIYGNGAGLTNIPASAVTGTIPASQVASAPAGMAYIPAGPFIMGNTVAADTDITDAAPVFATVSAFYMDANLVSWSQWQTVYYWAASNGYTDLGAGSGKAANNPVQSVTWYDCVKWCNARSQQAGKTPVYYTDAGFGTVYKTGSGTVYANWAAAGYRLPTEAEWEKAARGGLTGQRFPWGNTINFNLANYYGGQGGYDLAASGYNPIGSAGGTSPATRPVGSFAANGYGLYDMAGNVFEWCWDWYPSPFTSYAGGTDPHGAASGSNRVLRGGNWLNYAFNARCAIRNFISPTGAGNGVGFRAVLPPGQP